MHSLEIEARARSASPSRESLSDDGDNEQSPLTEEELAKARNAPDKAVTSRPPMLGYASTAFLIVNRMVGTGVFRTGTTLAQATHSMAWSLAFWGLGAVVAIAGAHVFAELGLALPLLLVNNVEQYVPRNGGELIYIQYFFGKPHLLATCLYGITFVIMGNVAANTLVFAQCVLGANGRVVNDWEVRGLAIVVAGVACTLHATWRKAGLFMNDTFGAIKVAILLAIFALGLAYAGGALYGGTETAIANLDPHLSNDGPNTGAYAYAQSWLAVLFSFGGFHQASYVLAEVKDCRRRFKVVSISTIAFVSLMFFLINLSFMFVVPKAEQIADGEDTVTKGFFRILFGASNGQKVQSAIMAFTSLGNIIVSTFTAARVKQEIAKTGVLPKSPFFANNYSLTPKFLRSKKDEGSEDTPAAAFALHWVFAVILILATVPAGDDSYRILVNVYSFVTNSVFGSLLGIGLLNLRIRSSSNWSKLSSSNHWISITAAGIYTIGNLFPLVGVWIPPSANDAFLAATKYWYLIGTIGVGLIGFALLWWATLVYTIPWGFGKQLETDREYNFTRDHGHWIVWHEVVSIDWKVCSSRT